jgi:hypothetical protein
MNQQPNFEKSIEKQKKLPEGQFSGEAGNIIKAKKMVTAVRSKFEIMLSKGEITSEKYAKKMGDLNNALVYLDKKIQKFGPEAQDAFYEAGAEASEKNLVFEKQGSEPVGFDEGVAIESGKEVVAIIEENLGVLKGIEADAGLINSADLGTFESREFREMSPQEKAGKNIANNLAKLAETDPNGAAEKIQQLTGITIDAGELLNTTKDQANRDVLELVSQELLKNFEFRIQEPTTAESFGFIVLDANNLSPVQQANFDFLKDLSMGPGYGSTIKNYSMENTQNRVIAYTKELTIGFEKTEGEIEQGQGFDSVKPGEQPIKSGVEAQTEKEVDRKVNPAKYYAQTETFTVNGASQSFKLPDQLPTNTKANERLQKLKTEGVAAYKASRVNAQPNLSNIADLQKPTWEPSDKPVGQQFENLANSSLDQDPAGAEGYTPESTAKPVSLETRGPANNIVGFKRREPKPVVDLSQGKKNIVNFNRKNTAPIKTEINDNPSQAKSQGKLAGVA